MATAFWYDLFFQYQLGTGANKLAWAADTVNVLLTTAATDATGTTARTTWDFRNDAVTEITGTNYSAGGVAVSGKAFIYDSASNETRLDCNDPTFTNISNPAAVIRHAVWYKVVGTAATDPLLWAYRFDGDQTVAAADFIIQLDVTGAAKIDST